jgi:hypothetical protein
MELLAQLVTAQRNVRDITAERTRYSGQEMER